MTLEVPSWLRRLGRFTLAVWDQFHQDKVIIRASGLAYASLLAIVPLGAVLFALFSAFGAFTEVRLRVQEFLFSQFLPTRQDEILGYLEQFTANVDKLGTLGFLALVVTSIMLLDGIESNFNEIWHVRARRSRIAKITSYTSVLVFGTLFIGASLTVSARVKTLLFSGGILDRGFIRSTAHWFVPLLLTVLGFLVVYLVVPFARVRLKSAALGAVVAGVLWELAKNLFADTIGQSVRYNTLYGSLAVFPIFLVWLYLTWVLVLLGLEIAFTHQHFPILERERERRLRAGNQPLLLALEIFGVVAERFHRREAPPTADELAERCLAPLDRVAETVERLGQAGLLRTVDGDADAGGGYLPATSLDRIRVADVAGLYLAAGDPAFDADKPLERAILEVVARFREAGEQAIDGVTFEDIVAPPESGAESAAESGDGTPHSERGASPDLLAASRRQPP